MSIVGNRIKSRREAMGMTQGQLAEKMGYKSKSTINKIEMGKVDVSQTKVVKFSEILNCTPGYLMNWEDATLEEMDRNDADSLDKELLEIIKDLDDDKMQNLIQYARFLAKE